MCSKAVVQQKKEGNNMLDSARFTMIDENFTCEVCGTEVKKLGYTARDHCPKCLCSKHVDVNPGDRLCNCHGVLTPIAIEPWKKGKYKIVYRCSSCGEIKRNVSAIDDDFDKMLEIMSNPRSMGSR